MRTTKALRQLIDDALAAGHGVQEFERHVRILPAKRGRPGIDISEDGTAVRNDLHNLGIATAIRTQREMRKLLGLAPAKVGNVNPTWQRLVEAEQHALRLRRALTSDPEAEHARLLAQLADAKAALALFEEALAAKSRGELPTIIAD